MLFQNNKKLLIVILDYFGCTRFHGGILDYKKNLTVGGGWRRDETSPAAVVVSARRANDMRNFNVLWGWRDKKNQK